MEHPCYSMSDEEIGFIRDEVRKNGISLPHLEEELIDHICCMIEDYLNEGHSFKAAFQKVKRNVRFNSLKDIEIQTLLLINKKLQAMKTTLKFTGIFGLVIILSSSILKIFHLPGAGPLLVLGFVILGFGYLPALFLTLKKEKLLKRKRNLAFVGIFTGFILLASLLFSIMHWPFREYTLYLTWIFVIIFLVMLFNNIMKSDENRVLHLSLLLFFVVIILLNISLYIVNLSDTKSNKYTIENNFEESIQLFDQKINQIYLSLDTIIESPQTKVLMEIKQNTGEITDQIESLRNAVFTSKTDKEQFNSRLIKNYRITNEVESKAMKLEKDLIQYQNYLLSKSDSNPALQNFIKQSIKFGSYDFNNSPPIIYNNLQRLIRDIKITEFELISKSL